MSKAAADQITPPADTPQDKPVDLTAPRTPPVYDAESEADHQIRLMIARRKPPGEKTEAVAPKDGEPAKPVEHVGDLLAKELKFRPSKKVEEKPAEVAKEEKKEPEKPAEEPKTVVRKRAQPAAIDPVKVATAAATAATAEAVKAMGDRGRAPAQADPAQDLSDPDRMEYEVVRFMADSDPKFKGADQVFLANVKKAEKYAESWEARNPGKPFDPEDDEHNEFFASVKQPYSPQELRRAEARMEARKEAKEATSKQDEKTREKLNTLESENARLKLAPKLTSTLQSTITHMATAMGDDVVASLKAGGPQKLAEDDPIAEGELRKSINSVSPIVQAIVEIESSDGLIEYNDKNPAHVRYAELLAQKEAEFSGVEVDGKVCVSRGEYAQMNPTQRAGHFFLTPENIIAELVSDEMEAAKVRMEAERNRIRKAAEKMGFVPRAATNGKVGATEATPPKKDPPKDLGSATAIKPASPSASTGAKIDVKDPAQSTAIDNVLDKVGGILFGR